MSDHNKINKALHEARGLKWTQGVDKERPFQGFCVPDYCNDLNAMAEVEARFNSLQKYRYADKIDTWMINNVEPCLTTLQSLFIALNIKPEVKAEIALEVLGGKI